MAKAIILTYAPVSNEDAKLLKNTDIFKIATNYSAAELKPNIRLTADDIVDKCLECDTCPVLSIHHDLGKDRVINASYLPNRKSSLLSCIDYLYLQGYDDVLLVATNPPDTATHIMNKRGVNNMKTSLYLYKYTEEGCFDIPYMTIKEFLMLTDEDRLLGVTDERPRLLIEKTVFSDACRYEVFSRGKDNKSIESGELIKSLLPFEYQRKLLEGADELEYNGIIIKKITKLVPDKKETKKAKEEPKEEVDVNTMSYQELLEYCEKNNIKAKTKKKADLIKAIKG